MRLGCPAVQTQNQSKVSVRHLAGPRKCLYLPEPGPALRLLLASVCLLLHSPPETLGEYLLNKCMNGRAKAWVVEITTNAELSFCEDTGVKCLFMLSFFILSTSQ